MITAIDHVDIAVKDLDVAAVQYEAMLGRKPAWSGDAEGARHVWFQMPNMALNLMAHTGPGATGEATRTRLDTVGEGVSALAFGVDDIAATQRLLERRGIPTSSAARVRAVNAQTGEKRYWNMSIASVAATHGTPIYIAENEPETALPLSAPIDDEASAVAELDHIVINTPNIERAVALYGGRLGLDLRLDRSNPQIGNRLLFFRVGTAVVEIGSRLGSVGDGPDRFGGLAWRVRNPELVNARLERAGFNVSEVRQGRKPGTAVFTVRDKNAGVPTIMIEQGAAASE